MTATRKKRPIPRQGLIHAFRKGFQAKARNVRQWANEVGANLPEPVRNRLEAPVAYADMLLVDHGIFRLAYLNRHKLAPGVYRAAQPAPHNIRRLKALGVKTIINLRGERDCSAYRLERKTCAAEGIEMIDFKLFSRALPSSETVLAAAALLKSIQYPMMMHCKSGADRVGLMSVLYKHVVAGEPIEIAARQLHWRYGHFRSADTGILDVMFSAYVAFDRETPTAFLDWVANHYNPVAIHRDFKASGLATLIVGKVLGRE